MVPALLLLALSPPPMSSLERGDEEFARRQYPLAEACYDSALSSSADSPEALWRLARLYVCMADVAPEDQELRLYRRAEAFAYRCIKADSMKPEGHTWRAAAMGNIAMAEGGRTKVTLCYAIKRELERSIALNPLDDIAHSILGSFYMALGDVSWIERQLAAIFLDKLPEGGYEESESALKTAIAIAPRVIHHHFELGRLYWKQERLHEAREEFLLVGILPLLLASDERTRRSAAGYLAALAGNRSDERDPGPSE